MPYTPAPEGWWQQFVQALPAHTGKLAVVKADGSPHVAPVWIDLDHDEVVFMRKGRGAALARALRAIVNEIEIEAAKAR